MSSSGSIDWATVGQYRDAGLTWPEVADWIGRRTGERPHPERLRGGYRRRAEQGSASGSTGPETVADKEPRQGRSGILFTTDPHFPVQDQGAIDAVVAFARDVKPRVWVHGGDTLENFLQSRFRKEACKLLDPSARLQYEIDAARPFLLASCEIAEDVRVIEGNHDARLRSAIDDRMPGLDGLEALRWPNLYRLPDNASFVGGSTRVGRIRFVHGDKHGGGIKYKVWGLLDRHGDHNIVCGHTHGLQMATKTSYRDDRREPKLAIAGGHLLDVAQLLWVPEDQLMGWTQGCVYFEEWGEDNFTPHPIPIVGGRFGWGGRVYGRPWQ